MASSFTTEIIKGTYIFLFKIMFKTSMVLRGSYMRVHSELILQYLLPLGRSEII
jgi:hypothetical protein